MDNLAFKLFHSMTILILTIYKEITTTALSGLQRETEN